MPVDWQLTIPTQNMLAIAASTAEPPRALKIFLDRQNTGMQSPRILHSNTNNT